MTVILLQIGATKLVLAIALAGTAWAVQRRVKRPTTVHALWLMVLVAMFLRSCRFGFCRMGRRRRLWRSPS